jgi:hypothetical protein
MVRNTFWGVCGGWMKGVGTFLYFTKIFFQILFNFIK